MSRRWERNTPDVATILNNLGQLYRQTGDVEQAKALLTQSLRILEKTQGTTHPDTIQTKNALAELLAQKEPEGPPA